MKGERRDQSQSSGDRSICMDLARSFNYGTHRDSAATLAAHSVAVGQAGFDQNDHHPFASGAGNQDITFS